MKTNIRAIGLLIESSHGAGRDLLTGIGRFVDTRSDWSVYWEPSGFDVAWPVLKNMRFDGLIVRDLSLTKELAKLSIPTVVMAPGEFNTPTISRIFTDSESIGRLAAEHLLACGFRHFAYLGIPANAQQAEPHWSEARRESFVRHIREAGHACATLSDAVDDHWHALDSMGRWLSSLPKPLGCMAANDGHASHVALACKLAGLRVPEQVGIIGVDNDELICTFCDPMLSSVAVSFERAGFEAAQYLDAWITSGRQPPPMPLVPAAFVAARRSTDVVAVEDENLAKALRYIRANLRGGRLAVADVARVAGLSRRTLERRFRLIIGRSIQDHIRRLRVGEITRAVVDTDMPTVKIARSLGFEDVQHFSRYFRSIQGVSPLEYRRQHRTLRTVDQRND